MSSEEPSVLDQLDEGTPQLLRGRSAGQRAASAGRERRAANLPPAADSRSQSQTSKSLVPSGHKPSDVATAGGSSRTSNSSLKTFPTASGIDGSHLPNINSGRSTPSGRSAALPAAPSPAAASPATKPRGIPKPQPSVRAAATASPAATSSSTQAPGRYVRPPRTDASPGADDNGDTDARVRGAGGEAGCVRDGSPGRDPREAGWSSMASKGAGQQAAAPRRDVKLSSPSEDERRKRMEWVRDKRRREEAKAREEADRLQAEGNKRREEEQVRLEARRAAIRDRIQKQHEVAARMAQERAKADEAAKGAIGRFLASKPLHQRLKEEYEKQQAEQEAEKKRQYDEEARNRHVRPHQIINGEAQVKPLHKADTSAAQATRSPGHSRGSGDPAAVSAGAGSAGGLSRSASARGRVATRVPRRESTSDVPASSSPQVAPRGAAGAPAAPKARMQAPPLASSASNKSGRRVANGLGSLSRRGGHLVDRACSPFIFNEAGVPVNVPPPTHVAANGSEVLRVDASAATSSPESSPEKDGRLAVTAGVVAGAAVTAAGIAVAVAVRSSTDAAEAGEDEAANAGPGPGGVSAVYGEDDEAPQMQSPIGLASSGLGAAYEAEQAAETEQAQETWGSDAADTDADTPVKAATEAGLQPQSRALAYTADDTSSPAGDARPPEASGQADDEQKQQLQAEEEQQPQEDEAGEVAGEEGPEVAYAREEAEPEDCPQPTAKTAPEDEVVKTTEEPEIPPQDDYEDDADLLEAADVDAQEGAARAAEEGADVEDMAPGKAAEEDAVDGMPSPLPHAAVAATEEDEEAEEAELGDGDEAAQVVAAAAAADNNEGEDEDPEVGTELEVADGKAEAAQTATRPDATEVNVPVMTEAEAVSSGGVTERESKGADSNPKASEGGAKREEGQAVAIENDVGGDTDQVVSGPVDETSQESAA